MQTPGAVVTLTCFGLAVLAARIPRSTAETEIYEENLGRVSQPAKHGAHQPRLLARGFDAVFEDGPKMAPIEATSHMDALVDDEPGKLTVRNKNTDLAFRGDPRQLRFDAASYDEEEDAMPPRMAKLQTMERVQSLPRPNRPMEDYQEQFQSESNRGHGGKSSQSEHEEAKDSIWKMHITSPTQSHSVTQGVNTQILPQTEPTPNAKTNDEPLLSANITDVTIQSQQTDATLQAQETDDQFPSPYQSETGPAADDIRGLLLRKLLSANPTPPMTKRPRSKPFSTHTLADLGLSYDQIESYCQGTQLCSVSSHGLKLVGEVNGETTVFSLPKSVVHVHAQNESPYILHLAPSWHLQFASWIKSLLNSLLGTLWGTEEKRIQNCPQCPAGTPQLAQ
ncbi:hypothetical protein XA68_17105 [Ophiocordyceps unilateralis]|uniref:Cryptic loci regulator 2 N-terminal domain-containing protein n=1 Tax=Ophiocordyceps unilateralis TaxID=268505 RepID=A0A2A9PJK1_OPHUN|nr:hypothetical protein XA68_17105 [Ophiocordyceps unilateralis]